ncbi:unnamed protein product [Candida verbasci]|uniref:Extradiol ring-cleavage dioxygenase class III enzyme subunit B domain-containing protein n=1 Tax=Candida verbasci TaxID=1227364 RepID=A0A9W4TZB1_9ASCO|nr:unnamed protein product [Candida verbasci]
MSTTTTTTTTTAAASTVSKFLTNQSPFPTYFFSHGAPSFLYKSESFSNKGAYNKITQLGKNITSNLKPDFLLVVSAHWQSHGQNLIEIGYPFMSKTHENSLIYDFYGFPNYMYKEQFHTKNDLSLAKLIKEELINVGFNSEIVDRGLDHGVWVPLKIAFANYNYENKIKRDDSKEFDLDIPVIQISLTSNDKDFDSHYKLGQILSKFKDNLVNIDGKELKGMIICSGMTVHNLRDISSSFNQPSQIMPYVKPFNQKLKQILTKDDQSKILQNLKDLKKDTMLFRAHPTLEHFLPLVVASGMNNKQIKEIYNDEFLSLGWGIYEFS